MCITSFLRRVPLFDCLGDRELESLAQLTFTRSFRTGEVVIRTGEPGDVLFIIRQGSVKVSLIRPNGKEVILTFLGEGEVFGELALLDNRPRSATVIGVEHGEFLLVKRPDFRRQMSREPQIAVALLEELASRLRKTDVQMGHLSLLDAYNRVLKTILRLALERGVETDDGILIQQLPSQEQVAHMAGTSRETVNRVLKQLEEEGDIICRGRQTLVLRDHSQEEHAHS